MNEITSTILKLVYEEKLIKSELEEVSIFSDYTTMDIYRHRVSFLDYPDNWFVSMLDQIEGKECECIEKILNNLSINFETIKKIEKHLQSHNPAYKILYDTTYFIQILSEKDYFETKTFLDIIVHEFDQKLFGKYKNDTNFELFGKTISEVELEQNIPYLNVQNLFENYEVIFNNESSFEEDYRFQSWQKQKTVIELVYTIKPILIDSRIKNYFYNKGWTILKDNYKYNLIKGEFLGRGSHCEVFALSNEVVQKKTKNRIFK